MTADGSRAPGFIPIRFLSYRYADGTVVFVAQNKHATQGTSNLRPLSQLQLTVPQLAALATDPKFHLK